jgi:hypothetical protein
MRPGKLVVRLAWLATGIVGIGCGAPPADDEAPVDNSSVDNVDTVDNRLWGDTARFWTQRPLVLPVCFEVNATNNPTAANDPDARRWIQQAVESNWSRFARITFTGWGDCPSVNTSVQGLRVQINTQGLNCTGTVCADAFGREVNGLANGVKIAQCLPGQSGPCGRPTREEAVTVMALHEFGHALGFQHEEDRKDSPRASCGNPPDVDGPTDRRYGSFDINSVMSTCGVLEKNSTWTELSPGDIAGAQYVYGRRIGGSLLTARGLCLKGGGFTPGQNGHRPYFGPCDEFADGDEWRRPSTSRRLTITPSGSPSSTACLHAPTTGNAEIRNCGTGSNFDWRFENVQIRGLGALCMDLSGGNTNGGSVIMFRCAGSKNRPDLNGTNQNQRWTVLRSDGNREIRFGSPSGNKCLTVPNGSAENGVGLTVTTCNDSASQKFDFQSNGEIRFGAKCLDIQGPTEAQWLAGSGLTDSGARVQLWDCANKVPFQRWNLSGPIRRNTNGTCLDWGSGLTGQMPFTLSCNNLTFQNWDFYPRP